MTFKPVRTRRAFEEVASQVRDRLRGGELKVGDRLPAERELSRQLNVSRSALREALRTLEIAGVIEMRKGKTGGAFISSGDQQVLSNTMADLLQLGNISLGHLTETRVWIEQIVVRVACARATAEDVKALEENLRLAQEYFERGLLIEKSDTNIEFHNILARATKNPVLAMIMKTMTDVLRVFARRLGAESTRQGFWSRARFLDALKARDAEAAVKEMERHLKKVHRVYVKLARELEQQAAGAPAVSTSARSVKRRRATPKNGSASRPARAVTRS
jgi:DNA-binding FadR family transcriptional regulator